MLRCCAYAELYFSMQFYRVACVIAFLWTLCSDVTGTLKGLLKFYHLLIINVCRELMFWFHVSMIAVN